jgi:hypothetical protein
MGFRGWTYGKLTVSVLLFFSMVYSVSFSATQLGRREAGGVRESLDRVAGQLGRDDIVFLVRDGFGLYSDIKTPLTFYYGGNIATVGGLNVPRNLLRAAVAAYDGVFLLTQKRDAVDAAWRYVGTFSYNDFRFTYTRTAIPSGTSHRSAVLLLYRLDREQFAGAGSAGAGSAAVSAE